MFEEHAEDDGTEIECDGKELTLTMSISDVCEMFDDNEADNEDDSDAVTALEYNWNNWNVGRNNLRTNGHFDLGSTNGRRRCNGCCTRNG